MNQSLGAVHLIIQTRRIPKDAIQWKTVKTEKMDNETYTTQLNVHLESRKHREFASNDSNYARIDELIIKNELEVETFKAKMYKET